MASPTSNSKIVHESEAQRQFVRVKLPASIQFVVDGNRKSYRLHDVSAGGFSFDPAGDKLPIGVTYSGHVLLNVDSVGFTIPVSFDAKSIDAESGRIGCVFQDLGAKEISALRQIITAFLGGELVSAGEMLSTLSRENFVRARGTGGGGLSVGGKLRALIGTTIALAVGAVAFGFATFKLYDLVFVTHATAAKVASTTYTITMPRDGTVFPTVALGATVKKGQAIGQFQTALLEVVEGVSGTFKLTPEQLGQLVGEQLKGSVASPCDCTIQKLFVTDGQYVLRNQSVMELVPAGTQPYVLARFHYDQMKHLPVGREISMRINGASKAVFGTISDLRILPAQTIDANGLNDLNGLNTNAAITDVIAVIQPKDPIEISHIDEPVEVLIDPFFDRFR